MSNKFCQSTNGNIFSSELSVMKSISSQKILNTFLVCIVCIEHIQLHITILRFFNIYENFFFPGALDPRTANSHELGETRDYLGSNNFLSPALSVCLPTSSYAACLTPFTVAMWRDCKTKKVLENRKQNFKPKKSSSGRACNSL